jgi:hypothetical protein
MYNSRPGRKNTMAGRKALHVWIDAALYDALQARKEREEKTFRDVVEAALFLGQRVYEEEEQQQPGGHAKDEQRHQREGDLLVRILREAGLARSLAEILLEYFLGPPAAQAYYERASRQIEEGM